MNDTTITTTKTNEDYMNNLKEMAKIAFASKKYGDEYNEFTILNIMLSARDLGISPFKALNGGFYIVKGKICMSTALMTDRIRAAGHSIKIPEWTSEKCVVIGVRSDNGDSIKFEYTVKDAQLAGLLGSATWQKFPKNMLYNRAMSTIARVLFPDVIGNCYSEDEKADIIGEVAEPLKIDMTDANVDEVLEDPFVSKFEQLICMVKKDGLNHEFLDEYMKEIADSKGVSKEKLAESAMKPEIYSIFKSKYLNHIKLEEEKLLNQKIL